MLEEVEMPVALRLGVVNRVQPFAAFARKAAALGEIDGNNQEPFAGVEAHVFDIPGRLDAKRRREKFVAHLPRRFPMHCSPSGDQNAAMLAAVKSKPCGRPLNERPFLTATARGSPLFA